MKAKIGLAILAVLLVVAFASCDFNANVLTGTNWTAEALGTGVGLKFVTATTGTTTVGAFGVWQDSDGFTYSYDSATKTGIITYDGLSSGSTFTRDGNEITWGFITYKYKP